MIFIDSAPPVTQGGIAGPLLRLLSDANQQERPRTVLDKVKPGEIISPKLLNKARQQGANLPPPHVPQRKKAKSTPLNPNPTSQESDDIRQGRTTRHKVVTPAVVDPPLRRTPENPRVRAKPNSATSECLDQCASLNEISAPSQMRSVLV